MKQQIQIIASIVAMLEKVTDTHKFLRISLDKDGGRVHLYCPSDEFKEMAKAFGQEVAIDERDDDLTEYSFDVDGVTFFRLEGF